MQVSFPRTMMVLFCTLYVPHVRMDEDFGDDIISRKRQFLWCNRSRSCSRKQFGFRGFPVCAVGIFYHPSGYSSVPS